MSEPAPSPLRAPGDDAAWQRFLTLLSPDARRAASSFEALRRRLVDVFRWRGLAGADDLADEAIERAVHKVGEVADLRSVVGYVCGVANKLALEAARREARVAPLDEQTRAGEPAPEAADDAGERLASLEQCLERMPPQTRRLVLRYYADEARIAERKRLADEMGIGLNALRIRVHRLRQALETCVGAGAAEAPRRPRGTTRPRDEAT